MSSTLIERSFTGILLVVGCLGVALVALRIVIGVARRQAAQRTDALLKTTLDAVPDGASERGSPAGDEGGKSEIHQG